MKKIALLSFLLCSANIAQAGTNDSKLKELEKILQAQQEQIQLLQKQLQSNQKLFNQLTEKVDENKESSENANKKAEAIAENIEATQAHSTDTTEIGGYGELHVNLLEKDNSNSDKNSLDFHRFVLFLGHQFNDRLRLFSELEIEHALSGDGKPGEVELEQAYIEYDLNSNHQLKAGVFLMPVGIINETHEPVTFYGVERNEVEKNIIPTTWWEGGLALNGTLAEGFQYDLTATSGLNTNVRNSYSIRSGRQKAAKATFNSAAYTARLRWTGIPGLELAASTQHQTDVTQDNDPTAGSATLFESHLNWQYKAFSLRALYATWSLSGSGPELIGADKQDGWYIEPSWRVNDQWGIFSRYSVWDNLAGNSIDTEYSQWDLGVNFWLHSNVVFKLDYQNQDAPTGQSAHDGWNLGVGYQF